MRIALHTRVRADRVAAYEQAHREVPPELTRAIREAGCSASGMRPSTGADANPVPVVRNTSASHQVAGAHGERGHCAAAIGHAPDLRGCRVVDRDGFAGDRDSSRV
ncbi:L-rhamnose mutarotase [Streptomyces anulatus]